MAEEASYRDGAFDGSPIAALDTNVPFSRLHFVEQGTEAYAAR